MAGSRYPLAARPASMRPLPPGPAPWHAQQAAWQAALYWAEQQRLATFNAASSVPGSDIVLRDGSTLTARDGSTIITR